VKEMSSTVMLLRFERSRKEARTVRMYISTIQ
jgi:hypothetical protein